MNHCTLLAPILALVSCATSPDFESLDHAGPVSAFDQIRFAGETEQASTANLAGTLNPFVLDRLPAEPVEADKLYDSAAWLKPFDFSGVSRVVAGNRRTATLISDRFVIMALHYHRSVGDEITWQRRDGSLMKRKLVKVAKSTATDLALGLLDRPADGVAAYRILPADRDWHEPLTRVLSVHTDQEHKAHVKMIVQAQTLADGRAGRITFFDPNWQRPTVPAVMVEKLVSGDSGNPFFVLWGDELVLLGTHWTTGTGPSLSDPDTVAWIQAAAASML